MITAAEAREKAYGSENILDSVMKSIEVRSENGEFYVNIPHGCLSDEDVDALRNLGYQVGINTYENGQIDVISWF